MTGSEQNQTAAPESAKRSFERRGHGAVTQPMIAVTKPVRSIPRYCLAGRKMQMTQGADKSRWNTPSQSNSVGSGIVGPAHSLQPFYNAGERCSALAPDSHIFRMTTIV